MRSLDISVEERSSRTAAEWLWPLLPIGVSVFCLSALVYYHLKHGLVEVRSALQVLIAGIYHTVGLAPAFLFFLLVGTWSTIWFVTGRLERPLLRLARLLAMAVMLGVFLNLGDGGVAAAAHKGELGAWLASCLVAAFGYFPSIVLVWAITFASLLLATDFFFSDSFERLRQRPTAGNRSDEQGVEAAVTDHLRGLAGTAPAQGGPISAFAVGAGAAVVDAGVEDAAQDEPEELSDAEPMDEGRHDPDPADRDPVEAVEPVPRRRRSYFERRYQEAADGTADLDVAAAAAGGGSSEATDEHMAPGAGAVAGPEDASAETPPPPTFVSFEAAPLVAATEDDTAAIAADEPSVAAADVRWDAGGDAADDDGHGVTASDAERRDDESDLLADGADEERVGAGAPDALEPAVGFAAVDTVPGAREQASAPLADGAHAAAGDAADRDVAAGGVDEGGAGDEVAAEHGAEGDLAAADAAPQGDVVAAADGMDDVLDDDALDGDALNGDALDDDTLDDDTLDDDATDDDVPEAEGTVVAIPRPEQPPRVPARQQQLFTPSVDEELVREALELASGQSRVTAAQLQRRLRIDYEQAKELMAQLGARGAVELDADATQGRVIA